MKYAVGLGANLEPREKNISRAIELISVRVGRIIRVSALRETEPLVPADEDPNSQPWYLNAVALCESSKAPRDVLALLLIIEKEIGRIRGTTEKRWQPRLIDLDIIAIDELIIDEPELSVPHPELSKRRFVVEPLAEIWPEWRHPRLQRSAIELLGDLSS